MLLPMLTAEWLKLGLYFSIEYRNSRQNIKVLLQKYLVDISSEACFGSTKVENILHKLWLFES